MAKIPKDVSMLFDMANIENDIGALEKSIEKLAKSKTQRDREVWIKTVNMWLGRLKADKNRLKKVM